MEKFGQLPVPGVIEAVEDAEGVVPDDALHGVVFLALVAGLTVQGVAEPFTAHGLCNHRGTVHEYGSQR